MVTEAQKAALTAAPGERAAEWKARTSTAPGPIVPASNSAMLARAIGWFVLVFGVFGGFLLAGLDLAVGVSVLGGSIVSAVGLWALAEIVTRLRVIAWKLWADTPAERAELF